MRIELSRFLALVMLAGWWLACPSALAASSAHSAHSASQRDGSTGAKAASLLSWVDQLSSGGLWSEERMADEASFRRFEEAAWLAEEEELPALEKIAVRHIQDFPHSQRAFYLLAVISLREASLSDDVSDAVDLLKLSSTLAAHATELDESSELGYMVTAELLRLGSDAVDGLEVIATAEKHLPTGQNSWRLRFMKACLQSSFWPEGEELPIRQIFEPLLKDNGVSRHLLASFISASVYKAATGPKKGQKMPPHFSVTAGRDYAVAELSRLDALYPDLYFKLTLASLLTEQQRFGMASGYYDMALEEDPGNHLALLASSSLLADQEAGNDARRSLSRLRRFEEAYAAGSATRMGPVVSVMRGQAYTSLRDFTRARGAYLSAAAALFSATGNEELRESYYREMLASYRQAKAPPAELIKLAEAITSGVSGSPVLFATLAEAYYPMNYRAGELDKTSIKIAKIATNKLSDPSQLNSSESLKKKGISYYEDAAILSPASGEYLQLLGLAYFQSGQLEEASRALRKALAINAGDVAALYCLARTQSLLGESQEALALLLFALQLSPKLAATAASEEDFLPLKALPVYQQLVKEKK